MLCYRRALFKINVKGGRGGGGGCGHNLNMYVWLIDPEYVSGSSRSAPHLTPTSAPLQGICAKWTSCTEINNVSPGLELDLTNKSCRQCWCSPPLYRWRQPSVCDCRQQWDWWKELGWTNGGGGGEGRSVYFHILRLKRQPHVQASVSPDGGATAAAGRAQLTASRWMNELEKHWAPGSSCVHTSIAVLYGSLSTGQGFTVMLAKTNTWYTARYYSMTPDCAKGWAHLGRFRTALNAAFGRGWMRMLCTGQPWQISCNTHIYMYYMWQTVKLK